MPQPPQIKKMEYFSLALPNSVVLDNGVVLHLIDGGAQDVMRIDLLFRGGYGVQTQPLQAMFTNRMLREGTQDYSATEISRRLDYYGAWTDVYSSQGCNHLTMYMMCKCAKPLLELLESMVKRPLFRKSALSTLRSSAKSFYKVNSRKVDIVAQRHFENMIWGNSHPLGHIVCAEDYDAITSDVLAQYYNSVYGSSQLEIFLCGKIDKQIVDYVAASFGGDSWGAPALTLCKPDAPVSECVTRKVTLDGVMQSGVKIGFMAMDANDPDFLKFRFLTVLLGGYFGSRLMSNIREEKGYTYHIEAELDAYGERNAFMISSETANDTVQPLIKEVYNEIDLLRNEPVSAEELELVRNYILGELCREYEGVFPKSEVFINAWLSGEKFSVVNDYLDVVRSITAEEIQRLAQKYLVPQSMVEVIAGS